MAAAAGDDKRRGGQATGFSAGTIEDQVEDHRAVAAIGDKAQEILGCDRRRAVVFERVIVERITLKHRLVEDDGNAPGRVIEERERCHAPRPDADVVFVNAQKEIGEVKRDIIRHIATPVMIVPGVHVPAGGDA